MTRNSGGVKAALAFLSIAALVRCSTLHGPSTSSLGLPFPQSAHPIEPQRVWTHQSKGPITDLKLAGVSGDVVYSEIPDADFAGSPPTPRLVRLDREGKVVWTRPLTSKVKEFDLSAEGDRLVVTTYDEKVAVFDARGQVIWKVQTFCHPRVLSRLKRVICFFDDDSQPNTAFQVYDWDGKKLWDFPVSREVLGLAVSPDEGLMGVTTTGGWLHVVSTSTGRTVQKRRAEGEWVHVELQGQGDVWSSAAGIIKVQGVGGTARGQRAIWLRPDGGSSTALEYRAERIAYAPGNGPSQFLIFGNTLQGQIYGVVAVQPDRTLMHRWSVREPKFSDYSIPVGVWADGWTVGFDASSSLALLGLDRQGEVRWSLPVKTQEGAYVYDVAERAVVLANDLGQLTFWNLGLNPRGGE